MLVLTDKNSCWPDDVFCHLVTGLTWLHHLHAGAPNLVLQLEPDPVRSRSEHPTSLSQRCSPPVTTVAGTVPGRLEGKPDQEQQVLRLCSQGLGGNTVHPAHCQPVLTKHSIPLP